MIPSAAQQLLGLKLDGDWRVVRRLTRHDEATGGHFSESYVVEREGRQGFLKAFDFSSAFQAADLAGEIARLTASYNNEREVLDHCGHRRLGKVVLAIGSGRVQVPSMGPMEGAVLYLIFEMADGDVRVQMSTATAEDALWCMRALKDVSLGLWQVHKEMIAHQDPKPSNVLCYPGPSFKIADFGRSSRKGRPAPHDELSIAGDTTYAPPELLYDYRDPEFAARRIGCDMYMLGNLAAFLFTGVNVTARLLGHLDRQHHPAVWSGGYRQALPYLRNAFSYVLEDLERMAEQSARQEVAALVRELCEPDIRLRGHPRGVGRHDQYSLERYVSRLDLAAKRLAVRGCRPSA